MGAPRHPVGAPRHPVGALTHPVGALTHPVGRFRPSRWGAQDTRWVALTVGVLGGKHRGELPVGGLVGLRIFHEKFFGDTFADFLYGKNFMGLYVN